MKNRLPSKALFLGQTRIPSRLTGFIHSASDYKMGTQSNTGRLGVARESPWLTRTECRRHTSGFCFTGRSKGAKLSLSQIRAGGMPI